MWKSWVEDGAVVAEAPLRFVGLVFDLGGEAQWGLPGAGVEALFHGHLKVNIFFLNYVPLHLCAQCHAKLSYLKQLRSLWTLNILLKEVPKRRESNYQRKGKSFSLGRDLSPA